MVEAGNLDSVDVEAVDKGLDVDTLADMVALLASSLYQCVE